MSASEHNQLPRIDVKLADELLSAANPNCNTCYGRGWTAYNQTLNKLVKCKCTEKKGERRYARAK